MGTYMPAQTLILELFLHPNLAFILLAGAFRDKFLHGCGAMALIS